MRRSQNSINHVHISARRMHLLARSFTRNVSKRAAVPWTRGLAQAASAKSISPAPVTKKIQSCDADIGTRVKEDHGLWAFFRRMKGKDLVGEARYETVEHPNMVEQARTGSYTRHHIFLTSILIICTGRAWRPSELRLKSFEDLHTLLSRRESTERRRKAWLKSQQASAEETENTSSKDAYARIEDTETVPTAT